MALETTPFAQTFFVDGTQSPNGVFIAAVDVCFQQIDDLLPIKVQIRPTINGFPDINTVYHNAEAMLLPGQIPTTTGSGADLPDLSNSNTYARFYFNGLVYLKPGEHALVFVTSSAKYLAYFATLQQPMLGSSRVVSGQPFVGSSFRSQSGGVWTPYQNEDLLFNLVRAKFKTGASTVIELDNDLESTDLHANTTYFDLFDVSSNDISVSGTHIDYKYKATDILGNLDTIQTPFSPNKNYIPSARKALTTTEGSFQVFATLSSDDDQTSPVLDSLRTNIIAVRNIINNGELSNSLIQIIDGGAGWSNGNVKVTIDDPTGTGGTTANGNAIVNGSGAIIKINLDILGARYIITPNIRVAGANSGVANIAFVGETSPSGGNALARYITKPITLNPGFDATDLQVFLSAAKQPGTDIQVYYKVLSAEDIDQNLSHKNWTLMYQNNNNGVFSVDDQDFVEYQYVSAGNVTPPHTGISYTANGITFTNFRTFVFKICLYSTSTITVPIINGFRGIATA